MQSFAVYTNCKTLHVLEGAHVMAIIETPRQVGLAVRKARKAEGITQKQLAKRAGVSERLVIALELGDATGIRLDKMLKVLSALDLSLAVLGPDCKGAKAHPEGRVDYAAVGFSDLEINLDLPSELSFDELMKGRK